MARLARDFRRGQHVIYCDRWGRTAHALILELWAHEDATFPYIPSEELIRPHALPWATLVTVFDGLHVGHTIKSTVPHRSLNKGGGCWLWPEELVTFLLPDPSGEPTEPTTT